MKMIWTTVVIVQDDKSYWMLSKDYVFKMCSVTIWSSTCPTQVLIYIRAIRTRNGQHSNKSPSFATQRRSSWPFMAQIGDRWWHGRAIQGSKQCKNINKKKLTKFFNEYPHHLEHLSASVQTSHSGEEFSDSSTCGGCIGSTKDGSWLGFAKCGSKRLQQLRSPEANIILSKQHPNCAKEWWRVGDACVGSSWHVSSTRCSPPLRQ